MAERETTHTHLYYLNDACEQLDRWAVIAREFCEGVTPHCELVVTPQVYAAHIGHLGRAVAGLAQARERNSGHRVRNIEDILIVEGTGPDPYRLGFSPVYALRPMILAKYANRSTDPSSTR